MGNQIRPDYPYYNSVKFSDFREMVEIPGSLHPDDFAFTYKNKPTDENPVHVTFSQVREDVRHLGTQLLSMGCRGKTCAIMGSATIGWIYSYFTLMAIGAITVPLDKDWPEDDLAATIKKADCEYIFYAGEISQKLEKIAAENPQIKAFINIWGKPRENDLLLKDLIAKGADLFASGRKDYYENPLDPDALASIVFTSGTTGKGKGVMLSQRNICDNMVNGMMLISVSLRTMFFLPPHHTFGSTVNLVGHFVQGAEIYLSSGLRYIQKELREFKPKHLILVPLFVETLYKKMWNGIREAKQEKVVRAMMKVSNGLRKIGIDKRKEMFKTLLNIFGGECDMIICGGAALSQEIIDMFDAIGISLLNGYGITECAPLISCNRNLYQKSGSVGAPIANELVKVRDPDENGEGELCVKGSNVMMGYYKDPEATAAVFDEEGYFRTGDWGKLDDDGWLYITGRLKNIIILANGKNVYPEELENELKTIDGVNEVVVYEGETNKKTDDSEKIIVAEFYPDSDRLQELGIEDIREYFESHVKEMNRKLPTYKQIHRVKLRDTEFPKNTSRKIVKFKIDKHIDE